MCSPQRESRERERGRYKRRIGTACSFVLPAISFSSGEKKSEIKMEIYRVRCFKSYERIERILMKDFAF